MKFVIQQNLMNDEQLRLTAEAVLPYLHIFVGLIPFSREITANEPLIGQDFIPYGSTLLTTLVKELGWKGLSFDLRTFNYEAALSNRNDMLNGGLLVPIVSALEYLHKDCDAEQYVFIRPSEDLKQFSGQVMQVKECREWLLDATKCESSGTYKLDLDTMVVIDNPQEIQAEWRWFIVDGMIIDGSMYRNRGQLVKQHETDTEVILEATKLARYWLPDPCCVMDTALVGDELKVIEFNCINSSGFYNHDVKKIFSELYKYHMSR